MKWAMVLILLVALCLANPGLMTFEKAYWSLAIIVGIVVAVPCLAWFIEQAP